MNGVPIVASVERCGWELPAWTLRGEVDCWLGAANFSVRIFGEDDVDDAKYYQLPDDLSDAMVPDCDSMDRADMVDFIYKNAGVRVLTRLCSAWAAAYVKVSRRASVRRKARVKPPPPRSARAQRGPARPWITHIVDELPVPDNRDFIIDLDNLGSSSSAATPQSPYAAKFQFAPFRRSVSRR